MINREPIYSAVFALLADIDGMKTVSRRLRHWADVHAVEQPAIFQTQTGEIPEQILKIPTKWKLNVCLWVYVNSGDDPTASPAILLNPIIDALEALFPSSEEDGPIQTLEGLVSHCWITSPGIETFEGLLGEQEVAKIYLEILTV